MIGCPPYRLPREFTSVILSAVYIPPHTDTNQALDELYGVISGDFNKANLRKVLTRYHQHISCPARGENTLDHACAPFRDAYKALPRPPFGKSDHVSVLLLPSYRQKLKRDRPVTRTIQQWSDQSDLALRHCFSTTEWCVFQDNNIDTHGRSHWLLWQMYR